jgi:hypothetical protein
MDLDFEKLLNSTEYSKIWTNLNIEYILTEILVFLNNNRLSQLVFLSMLHYGYTIKATLGYNLQVWLKFTKMGEKIYTSPNF